MTINPIQEIEKLLLEQRNQKSSATQEKNFAQRLRDERMGQVQQFDASIAGLFTDDAPVPVDPIERSERKTAFLEAGKGILDPVDRRIKLAQDALTDTQENEMTLLGLLLGQQNRKEDIAREDRWKALESGFDWVDGKFVPLEGIDINEKKRKELLSERKMMMDQGLDTETLDVQLRAMGVFKDTGERAKIVALVNDILKNESLIEPLIGDVRVGGIPLVNRAKVQSMKAKIDQLQATLNVEGAAKLRGQGQISEGERALISAAASRLGNKEQNTSEYTQHLKDIRDVLQVDIFANTPQNDTTSLIDKYWGE